MEKIIWTKNNLIDEKKFYKNLEEQVNKHLALGETPKLKLWHSSKPQIVTKLNLWQNNTIRVKFYHNLCFWVSSQRVEFHKNFNF